ncbi:hypothetical protein V1520DRAFT_372565 [Lipomyces starkeyi]
MTKSVPLDAVLRAKLLIVLVIGLGLSYQFLNSSWCLAASVETHSTDLFSATHQAELAKHAHNGSLGFGEILIHGVNGSAVSPKTIPDEASRDIIPSTLGCYRAHANTWRYLLETDMDTLLILEDDLDWNPNLKRTMETLSIQMQDSNIRQTSPSDYERENAPYGLDWDVLYLGSWRHGGHPDFSDIFQKLGRKRVLAPAYSTLKTTAYAITRRGAQRLLFLLSYIGDLKHGDVDQDITRLFQEGRLRGYSLTPPAFSQFKVGGTKDSDNENLLGSQEGKGNLRGWSPDLNVSARKSMAKSLKLENWNEYKRIREKISSTITRHY